MRTVLLISQISPPKDKPSPVVQFVAALNWLIGYRLRQVQLIFICIHPFVRHYSWLYLSSQFIVLCTVTVHFIIYHWIHVYPLCKHFSIMCTHCSIFGLQYSLCSILLNMFHEGPFPLNIFLIYLPDLTVKMHHMPFKRAIFLFLIISTRYSPGHRVSGLTMRLYICSSVDLQVKVFVIQKCTCMRQITNQTTQRETTFRTYCLHL